MVEEITDVHLLLQVLRNVCKGEAFKVRLLDQLDKQFKRQNKLAGDMHKVNKEFHKQLWMQNQIIDDFVSRTPEIPINTIAGFFDTSKDDQQTKI